MSAKTIPEYQAAFEAKDKLIAEMEKQAEVTFNHMMSQNRCLRKGKRLRKALREYTIAHAQMNLAIVGWDEAELAHREEQQK